MAKTYYILTMTEIPFYLLKHSLSTYFIPIFISIGFILAFYFSFVLIYLTMFPGKDPRILPNLLQVIAQLS
jgi:hypothetical protein